MHSYHIHKTKFYFERSITLYVPINNNIIITIKIKMLDHLLESDME